MPSLCEDRDALRDVAARYCHSFDRGDADGVAELFTEDGVFDPGFPGFEAVASREAIRAFGAGMTPGSVHHMVTDLAYDIDGDRATGDASFIVTAGTAIVTAGRYHDELVRLDGAWRYRRRVAVADPT
jgi:uncharacterized protein (TIGR02246 family)